MSDKLTPPPAREPIVTVTMDQSGRTATVQLSRAWMKWFSDLYLAVKTS